MKGECLDRLIPLSERQFGQAVAEFVAHYHRERNHRGEFGAVAGHYGLARCCTHGRGLDRKPVVGCSTAKSNRWRVGHFAALGKQFLPRVLMHITSHQGHF